MKTRRMLHIWFANERSARFGPLEVTQHWMLRHRGDLIAPRASLAISAFTSWSAMYSWCVSNLIQFGYENRMRRRRGGTSITGSPAYRTDEFVTRKFGPAIRKLHTKSLEIVISRNAKGMGETEMGRLKPPNGFLLLHLFDETSTVSFARNWFGCFCAGKSPCSTHPCSLRFTAKQYLFCSN